LFGEFVTNPVTSLHISPFENTSSQLKYKLKGLTISTAHAAVVKNAPVRYIREITGISMYLCVTKDNRRNNSVLEIEMKIDLGLIFQGTAQKNRFDTRQKRTYHDMTSGAAPCC